MVSRHKAIAAALMAALVGSTLAACGGTQAMKPRIVEDGTSIVIVDDANDSIPIDIRFEVDSDMLSPSAHAPLDALAEFLKARDDYRLIEVQGHSDERGGEAYNQVLSTRRAQSVLDYLVGRGVEPARLRARGFGSTRPAVQGNDETAFSRNRRVEFLIVTQTAS